MQAIVVLPTPAESEGAGYEEQLFRRVAGLPLLVRVLATAARSGVTSALIVRPLDLDESWLRTRLQSPLLAPLSIQIIAVEERFDPCSSAHWSLVAPDLRPQFVWLPWNYVTLTRSLRALVAAGQSGGSSQRPPEPKAAFEAEPGAPALVVTHALLTSYRGRLDEYVRDPASPYAVAADVPGIAVDSEGTRRRAERLLVGGSGKATDGFHATFNRRLCRPLVRWLANRPVTPNMVTLTALPMLAISAYWYAQGYWSAYVAGALLYFLALLVDEMDGMLARATFQESPLGCRIDAVVDYSSYLSLFAGISIGLSRQYGSPVWIAVGALTGVMSVMAFFARERLRQMATTPDKPEQMYNRFMSRLGSDSTNPISRAIRTLVTFTKKGVMTHYVVIFTVLGLLPLVAALGVFGSLTTLAGILYSYRYFRVPAIGAAMALDNSRLQRS